MSPGTELWQRATVRRAREAAPRNYGARARLVLWRLLADAGHPTSLVTIATWPRAWQGDAYLWAYAFVNGREDMPPPAFLLVDAAATPREV
jgi:hypothetical protein